MTPQRFPPPWSLDELAECFSVRDGNGQALGCVHFKDEPGRRAAAKLLTRGIVINFAKLPDLLTQTEGT
jgi:hypothetical protein